MDSEALLQRVDALFHASGCATDAQALTELATQGADGAVKSGAVASSIVYGELLSPLSVFQLLDLNQEDTFYDLGSGRGQVVLAAAFAGVSQRAVGVELLEARHQAALGAKAVAPEEVQRQCDFRCQDALTCDLQDASKVYLCNAAFPRHLNASFARSLGPWRAPRLAALATCAALPEATRAVADLGVEDLLSTDGSTTSA
ncbi:unnamed protein product [Effrenium voratum]|uniref:DOT1 domain-containing protein n=1 Tax=Effrenium voratum TaxID=2562239 RepID=A0AA36JG21_9DINO|nr:unnamed protein product [Effrenium voratum]